MDQSVCDNNWRFNRRPSGPDNRPSDICRAFGYGDTLATNKRIANPIRDAARRYSAAMIGYHVYEVRPRKDKRGFDLISDSSIQRKARRRIRPRQIAACEHQELLGTRYHVVRRRKAFRKISL
jgi:hypothetical protein